MKRRVLIKTITIVIIILSISSSIPSIQLNYRALNFNDYLTVEGTHVQYLTDGIYKNNVKSWVLAGIPWDYVRLFLVIPLLIISFVLYLKRSIKGTLVLVGVLLSLFYQYFLWAIGWKFNSLFLVYTLTYSLCLLGSIIICVNLEFEKLEKIFKKGFPQKLTSGFLFLISALLLFKCLAEIFPNIFQGELTSQFSGYYTLFDQSIDLGLIIPFCLFTGILLLNNKPLGIVFSIAALIMFLNIGLAVISGELLTGLTLDGDKIKIEGILAFSVLLFLDLHIIFRILRQNHSDTTANISV
jgi:hypothetical protein